MVDESITRWRAREQFGSGFSLHAWKRRTDLGAAATFFEAAAEGGLAEAQYVAQNSACLSTYVV